MRNSSAEESGFQVLILKLTSAIFGGVAQLARAPALQAGGQRFDSVHLHFFTTIAPAKVQCDYD